MHSFHQGILGVVAYQLIACDFRMEMEIGLKLGFLNKYPNTIFGLSQSFDSLIFRLKDKLNLQCTPVTIYGGIRILVSLQVTLCHYNESVNGPQARNGWLSVIHGEKGAAMGRSLLTQDLIDHRDFQFFLDDKEKWLPMVESLLQDEIYIIGTIVKQLTAKVNLPGKMKFFVLQALGSKKIDQIADKWIACSNKNIVQPALDFIRKDNHLEFISAWLDDDPYYNEVNDACNEHSSRKHGSYVYYYYGEGVHWWLDSLFYGPRIYGLTVKYQVYYVSFYRKSRWLLFSWYHGDCRRKQRYAYRRSSRK